MIGLAYALKGEIRSMLHSADAKPLETAAGTAVYEIEPGIPAVHRPLPPGLDHQRRRGR